MAITTPRSVDKLLTYIPGFDHITSGGLPKYRTTLVSGSSGSAKTIFAAQFLAAGIINAGEKGVFLTFEESPDDIRRNLFSMGWDIESWEREGHWTFIDASLRPEEDAVISGNYDLGALLARIEYAVKTCGADRFSLDSLDSLFSRFSDRGTVRREMLRIVSALKKIQVTAVMTAERDQEYGVISSYGVEEFVADNVIILRNALYGEKRRRTVEVLKFRGTIHKKGEHPFTVVPGVGLVVIALSAIALTQQSLADRITTGNDELDVMCGGGFFRDSVILVSGSTGTGKSLFTTEFIAGGLNSGERTLLFAYEEGREQILRNISGLKGHFEEKEKEGKLKVVCQYPEVMSLEEHLISIKTMIADFKPSRIALDSITALQRVGSPKGFHEFVIGLAALLKTEKTAGLFTSTAPALLGMISVSETHISSMTDAIILLSHVELNGQMRRALTVLKMRGSTHESEIREFFIDASGLHIEKPFHNVNGILSGNPIQISPLELHEC